MKTFRNRDGSGLSSYRYIHEDIDRHENVRIYFWRGKGHRKIRIRALPGTREFQAEYEAAFQADTGNDAAPPSSDKPERRPPPIPNTWRWLCTRYLGSAEFQVLEESTKRARRGILEATWEEPIAPNAKACFGDVPLSKMTAQAIRVLRDRKSSLSEAANGRVKAARQVFAWGLENETAAVLANPARDVKYLKGNPEGFHTWTIGEVRKFEERHPLGTKARLALALLLFTGVRRSDVVRLGRQMVSSGWLRFTEVKAARSNPKQRELPILPALQVIIDATPSGHMTYLVTEFGKPFTRAGFGNKFRDWCNQAGLPDCRTAPRMDSARPAQQLPPTTARRRTS
jgi:integrase